MEESLRKLVAGLLPLSLLRSQLELLEEQVQHEREIRHAKALVEALEERDQEVVSKLRREGLPGNSVDFLERTLASDREERTGLAGESLLLDAPDSLAPQVRHLITVALPSAAAQARHLLVQLETVKEQIARLESDLARVPDADRIAAIQSALVAKRTEHANRFAELQLLRQRREALSRQRVDLESCLDRIWQAQFELQVRQDDSDRILKHSAKVRCTLESFRALVIKRHTRNMESLMLESFQMLLRKGELVKSLSIDPTTFEASLIGRDGKNIPFDRLSAGERQLLATSMLWGLARASGRPIPTIIDTPLGRLDSGHRSHLIERYFPNASHQVVLLSTDEEIAGNYLEALRPAITRSYLLDHDEAQGSTAIKDGYFV